MCRAVNDISANLIVEACSRLSNHSNCDNGTMLLWLHRDILASREGGGSTCKRSITIRNNLIVYCSR